MKSIVIVSALLLVALFQTTNGANEEMNLELAEVQFHEALNEIYIKVRFIEQNIDSKAEQKICALAVKDRAIAIKVKTNVSLNTCRGPEIAKDLQCKINLVQQGTKEIKDLSPELNKC